MLRSGDDEEEEEKNGKERRGRPSAFHQCCSLLLPLLLFFLIFGCLLIFFPLFFLCFRLACEVDSEAFLLIERDRYMSIVLLLFHLLIRFYRLIVVGVGIFTIFFTYSSELLPVKCSSKIHFFLFSVHFS